MSPDGPDIINRSPDSYHAQYMNRITDPDMNRDHMLDVDKYVYPNHPDRELLPEPEPEVEPGSWPLPSSVPDPMDSRNFNPGYVWSDMYEKFIKGVDDVIKSVDVIDHVEGEFPEDGAVGRITTSDGLTYTTDNNTGIIYVTKENKKVTPTIPKTGQCFKDWAWKPEGYFKEESAMTDTLILNCKRLMFQWKVSDGCLEIIDPVSFHKDPNNKDVTVYTNKIGNRFCVRNTWDVMIMVDK